MNIEDRMSIPRTRHQTGPPGVGTEQGRRAGRRLQPAIAPCAAPQSPLSSRSEHLPVNREKNRRTSRRGEEQVSTPADGLTSFMEQRRQKNRYSAGFRLCKVTNIKIKVVYA